ncbi:MAG: tetratricopeptide repeat protein, partial [Proteobacteria bacterium]|nr:tetratricopeptide repeat protein [Pseudomonadota bacterium]
MKPSAPTAADLQPALTLLRQGRHVEARTLLHKLSLAQPQRVDIRWILAGSHFQSGESTRALQELQALVRIDPAHAGAYSLSGRIYLSMNHFEAAEPMFRRALQLHPDPEAAAGLARALLMQSRPVDAVEAIVAFRQRGQATPELLLLLGHGLMTLGRSDDAVHAFREWVQLSPGDGEAKVRLAAALSDSGRHAEAETHARNGIAQGVRSPEAHFVLGRALMGQSKLEQAEPELRRVVSDKPDHITAQANLSELLWMRTGDATNASREIDVALRLHPQFSPLRIAKANLLVSAGEHEHALRQVEEGIVAGAAPRELLNLHVAAARIAIETDAKRAVEHAKRALQIDPEHRLARSAYGDALLAEGAATQAMDVALQLLEGDRYDGRAIALLASAARMAGDARYRGLFDYGNLVLAQSIDVPPGWANLTEYLADLAQALQRLHSSDVHPVGQSLRQGSQIELDLERAPEPAIRAFATAMDGPIGRYLAHIGRGSDPLRARNTGRYRVKGAWSVRLRPHGFHVNHYHP